MKCPKCELEWNNENSEYVPTEEYIYCYECQGYIVSIDSTDYINEMYQQRLDKVLSKFEESFMDNILDYEIGLDASDICIYYNLKEKYFYIGYDCGWGKTKHLSLDTVESLLKDLEELND